MRLLVSEGFFFMFVVLKLPVLAISIVLYWAFNAEPRPLQPVRAVVPDGRPWSPLGRSARAGRGRGPHGPARRPGGRRRRSPALARAEARR